MPHRLSKSHWKTFLNDPFVPQGEFGSKPAVWAAQHEIAAQGHPLPAHRLTRQQVRAVCQDPSLPVLHGYICAMAWGLQGAAGRGKHVRNAWAGRDEIARRLTLLRAGGFSRRRAYDLFAEDPIPGLGPSYFTKLIYFFRPDADVGYIMDQWTGKSVNLLTGHHVVRMYGAAPAAANTSENYEGFCRVVDWLATHTGCTGDELEQRLFSQNGQFRRPRGPWRAYVVKSWDDQRPRHRYDHGDLMAWVAGL